MLTRQKSILSLLRISGGQATRLDLVKKAFLLKNETPSQGGPSFYDFLPYHYGPYSFTLSQEINTLVKTGYLAETDAKTWSLTQTGQAAAEPIPDIIRRDIISLHLKYSDVPTDTLIEKVYSEYPWFTVNAKNEKKRRMQKPETEIAIYTMGYEGLSIDRFLNALLTKGINRILDVRNNPVSMRYGFHKNTLCRLAKMVEIEYRHFPELGIPSELRRGLKTPAEYTSLFETYEKSILPAQNEAVSRLTDALKERPGVIMCSEANPDYCHRSRMANAIASDCGLKIIHLNRPQ